MAAPTPPKLLGPDYFKTKLVVSNAEMTSATNDTQQGQCFTIPTSTGPAYLAARPDKLLSGREQSNTSYRTRDTPAAEAAIKREELRKTKLKTSASIELVGAVKKETAGRHLFCDSPSLPILSATTRDCGSDDWTGWTLNDLDPHIQQPTTRPFVESVMTSTTSSLTTASPVMENFNTWGQPIIYATSETLAEVSITDKTRQVEGQSDATSTASQTANDEVMADLLQKDEYSRNVEQNWEMDCENFSYSVARIYQEDLDATAAQELQQRETQYPATDTEGGSKYLYKAPRGLQVKNKCSSFEGDSGPFSGRRPSEQRVEPRREAPMVVHGLDQEYHQAAIAPHGLDQDPQEAPLTACGLDQSHGMTFAGSASGGHSVPRTVHHQTDNMDMSYEALLDLEDVSCGLNKDVLDHCTNTRSYKERDGASTESRTCTVCLTVFREGQLVRYLPCLHSFHCHCIDQWLDSHANCPVCMKSIEELHVAMSS